MSMCKRSIMEILTALIAIALIMAFVPGLSEPVHGATSKITVNSLKADATVSQDSLQTDIKALGYRYVKLSWSSSSAADKYMIYSATSKSGKYKKLATVTDKSATLLLSQKVTYLKVRAYKSRAYGPYTDWVSVKAGSTSNSTKVTFSSSSKQITVGDTKTYKAKANGSVSTSVRWSSSDSSKATVSNSGVVKAIKAGTVKITATAHDGIAKSVSTITIDKYPASIAISGSSSRTVANGKTLKLTATPAKAVYETVTWSSSNSSIATVSATGKIKGKAEGKATITVTAIGGATDKVKVKVVPGIESMVQWALKIAADDSFGYSMGKSYRSDITGKTYPGDRFCPFCHIGASKDYDCASFVIAALAHGLQDPDFEANCAGSTYACGGLNSMLNKSDSFENMGKLSKSKLVRGDILINPSAHVEIYIGDGQDVGAHEDWDTLSGDSTGNEIDIGSVYGGYTKVYRYTGK